MNQVPMCRGEKYFAPTKKFHRRSIRLKGYDYAKEGVYFVTICTHNHALLFGQVVEGKIIINEWGKMAEQFWKAIPAHFPNTELDEFVIMPNHVHGIVILKAPVGAKNISLFQSQPKQQSCAIGTIGSIVRGFKIGLTKWARLRNYQNPVWQRNYYDHVIRDEADLNRTREYINTNPDRWEEDKENPERAKNGSPLPPEMHMNKGENDDRRYP
jgi:putative transposase